MDKRTSRTQHLDTSVVHTCNEIVSGLKKERNLTQAAIPINLENIMLCETSSTQKDNTV
jgi:hypothetical protein